ncbi:MAG: DnaJ domain-containing protein [Caulobacter sp.]|nr:DnaJ domain-containing protein [Caulobacter sp.]
MIYLLLFGALVALLVWTGRRAAPRLRIRDWRVVTGGLSALTLLGGAAAASRGGWLIGGGLILVGGALALAARKQPPRPPAPVASDSEARAILGVGPNADEAEIKAAYSRLIRMAHPDRGGTSGLAAQLNAARDQLLGRLK